MGLEMAHQGAGLAKTNLGYIGVHIPQACNETESSIRGIDAEHHQIVERCMGQALHGL